jgi:NAD(P)-dependent dehydrogenase (short-subunit alcohol dehydrogenase family)
VTRSLKGKTLFITGASRGLGRAIALRAARDEASAAGHFVLQLATRTSWHLAN